MKLKLESIKLRLRPDQDKALRDRSKASGAPIAEEARRAIDLGLGLAPRGGGETDEPQRTDT